MQKKKGYIILISAFSLLALSGFLFRKQITRAYRKLKDSDKITFLLKVLPSVKVIGDRIGVPYLFILAQISLESNFGQSLLTKNYNNFGGIKATPGQNKVSLLTTENINGINKKIYQDFAVFPTPEAGLLAQAKIYQNKYFRQYLNKTKNPIDYAKLIQSGQPKYATALNYVDAIQNALNEIKRLKIA